ncbi:MAG: aminotransferase class I/II-fold pyridoxal phosphate-dependent enzyme [Ignavibacteriales bacterium]|nr:aminotransferase class I/II-fold pyridoxal phosphate-dependent enzyme [Ignavibacteriales bacterium]
MSAEKKGGVDESRYRMETQLIYGRDFTPKWNYQHHVIPPLSSSVIYRLDSVERGAEGFVEFANPEYLSEDRDPIYIYDRLGEPNKDMLEENLAHVERGETAVTFSAGMGAISSVLGVLTKAGEEIVANGTLYGCTYSLLKNWFPRWNVKTTFVDLKNVENLKNAVTDKTRVVYFESPSNPTLEVIDVAETRKAIDEINETRGEEEKIHIVVDNTFATPYCQRPLEHGAHFVVHSLTKGIGGFGADMGGVVVGPRKWKDRILLFRKDLGAVMSPKAAWPVLTYGLSTLHLRLSRMVKSAWKLAEFLETRDEIEYVNYPGLKSYHRHDIAKKQMLDFEGEFAPGALLFFGLKGETNEEKKERGRRFMNYAAENAYTLTLAVSLGHTRTLIEHPASMTHSMIPTEELVEAGVDPGGVRIALGLENVDDLIQDVERCLEAV